MIFQTLTTDTISLITDVACSVDVVASFIDRSQSTGLAGLADKQLTNVTTAATTTIVSGPASSTTRNLKALSVLNTNTFSNVAVTVQLSANGTLFELHKQTLNPQECLRYTEGYGFTSVRDSIRLERTFIMTANSVHTNTSPFTNVGNLSCALKGNVIYGYMACLHHISNATTTGARFAIGYTGSGNFIVGLIDTVTGNPTASIHSTNTQNNPNTAISLQTTGCANIQMGILCGTFAPLSDGTLSIRATPSVNNAAGLTVVAGSWLKVFRRTAEG
jgi:hypothetical protein